ncbi:peptide deformylase [Nakamurella panacisegetis]|uniref:Peptide deformylase n=1 Tax=Nakamurella panacisegetis TaxID=1090615 RepID=A0A1H0QYR4_9ACTN|nr:peptide deformylase [Nakamurella panacisegetis]SDP22384.1 peptide deformylase [Nakamurella panacisegetis]
MSLESQVDQLLAGPRPLPIVQAGHPVLRHRAEPYDFSLPADVFDHLIGAMRETMLTAPGVGLAAPQIGLGIQVAVLEDAAPVSSEVARVRDRTPLPFRVLVNPSYRPETDDVAAFYEGCLSVPGYQAVVERAATVRLRALDQNGAPIDEIVTGWAARIVAHETDHLAGILYLDKAFTRSLTNNEHYLTRWAGATPQAARVELGF